MEAKRKRLTLDLDPPVHRRLKVAATLKGISMRQYCLTAIDKELAIDGVDRLPSGRFDIAVLSALRGEIFGDKELSRDGAEFIREARESRGIS